MRVALAIAGLSLLALSACSSTTTQIPSTSPTLSPTPNPVEPACEQFTAMVDGYNELARTSLTPSSKYELTRGLWLDGRDMAALHWPHVEDPDLKSVLKTMASDLNWGTSFISLGSICGFTSQVEPHLPAEFIPLTE